VRVLVAGATGAIGSRLLPQLVAAGYEVIGMTRSRDKARAIRAAGGMPVICDVFEAARVHQVIAESRPEAIIDELTDLPHEMDLGGLAKAYEANNRVRKEGTKNLVAAALAAGVRRFVVQSMAMWYAPGGQTPKTESDELYLKAPEPVGSAVRALKYMEELVLNSGLEGIVLRYGAFYGPGSWNGTNGSTYRQVLKRHYPLIGEGSGFYSFIQIDDAAAATVAALERAKPGIYNVADDDPVPARDWLPAYAQAIGARPPRRVPMWLAGLLAGRGLVNWESTIPAVSSRKIQQELGWKPRYRSWRCGFVEALG
jgi:nucleoside-diphosphate-sugar epimerase